jgi:Ca2+-binding RTX toxin-like protein
MIPYRNVEGSATWALTDNRASLWAPGSTITYSFDANLDAQERAFIRAAMDMWQDIADIQFVEQAGGHVRIAFDPTIPYNPLNFVGGQTNGYGPQATSLVLNQQAYDGALDLSKVGRSFTATSAFEVTVHELGHVLGFHHPAPYNGTSATPSDAIYYEDTLGYTVMSYWMPDRNDTQPWTAMDFDFISLKPSAPQALDLLVAQFVYGANMATRAGDDTYFYNSTLAASSPLSFETSATFFAGALWDGGGYDTLDLSGTGNAQRVDLRDPKPGAGPLHERLFIEDIGTFNDAFGGKGNLFIAANVQIERVIGGRGKDIFTARDGVNTTLDGRDGADTLNGGSGDDKLLAGADNFQDVLSGGGGRDQYLIFGGDRILDTSGGSEVVIGEGWKGSVAKIDLMAGDDTVSVFGVVDVVADLGSGKDFYEGGDGYDVLKIVVGATITGSGDQVTLGDGNDKVTASLSGGWGSGKDIFDGGDGEDTFIGKFVVDLSLTDLSSGVTSLPGLDARLSISNFEHVSFAGARATIAAWGAPTLTSNSIATSSLDDEVAINFDSNFTKVDTGDGADSVDGDIARLSDHDITSTLDRIISLGGGNDRYIAGAMSHGTHQYDGGAGTDMLDLSLLDEIEWTQGFPSYRSAADKVVKFDAVTGVLDGHFAWFDPIGSGGTYDFTAQVSGFENYVFELGGTLRFSGDPGAATGITLTGSGFVDALIDLGSGDDTVALLDFRPDADQPVVLNAGMGRDTLDLSGLVVVPAASPSFATEDVTIDRQANLLSRYIDASSSRTVTAAINGFEVFYLPDLLVDGADDGRTVITHFIGINGVDEVHGGVRDDFIEGFGGDDLLFGGLGADRLHGGGGRDKMTGGAGNDTYYVDNIGDVVIEGADEGANDVVTSSITYTLAAGVHAEMLRTTSNGGTSAIDLTGNALAQQIMGNAGVNTLRDGGGAGDVLRGLGGDDTYRVYSSATTIVEGATQGAADRVATAVNFALGAGVYVEIMTTNGATGTSAINLTGNALRQEIVGNDGANILNDGGAGAADKMTGRGGNDIYRVFNSGDIIVETSASDTADRVIAAVDYRLGTGVRVELMSTENSTGVSGIDLTGNEFVQSITGNAGDNRLEGKGGSDTLRGLGGKDTFVFASTIGAANVDTIVDFNVADDRFLLSDAIFKALTPGLLSANAFQANTTGLAVDADDRIIYETDTGKLFYDADGTGAGAGIQFAKLSVGLALTNADFSVA